MDTDKMLKTRFDGRMIEFKPLTQGQFVALQTMTDATPPDENDEEAVQAYAEKAKRNMHRLFRVIESRLSPQEWERIDDGMVTGTVDLSDVMSLVSKMMNASSKDQPEQ